MSHLSTKLFKNNFFLITGLIVCMVCLFPQSTPAASTKKTVHVSIKQDYESCTFFVKLENSGRYSVKIKSPDGVVHKADKIDSQNFRCVIPDVTIGKWNVIVTRKGNEKIGKVTISVTASKSNDNSIASDIKVGKDIVGLKVYFKDNFICTDWTDDTCGNVYVKVIDLDSNQVIADDAVSEKHFEAEIPTGVRKISVSVVPSESASIRGAEKSYVLKAGFDPNATVSFPSEYFINKDNLTANIVFNKPYGYVITDNESVIAKSKKNLDAGKYEIQIPIKNEGEHTIKFFVVDKKGNMKSTSVLINKDTTAPYMALSKEYDGYRTSESSILIEGTVKDYSEVTVEGDKIIPTTDGHFEKECSLHTGENSITITAKDEAGNVTKSSFVITKYEQKTPILSPKSLILLVLLFITVIVLKKKRRKKAIINSKESD